MTADRAPLPVPARPPSRRAGKGWWILASVMLVAGWLTALAIIRVAAPGDAGLAKSLATSPGGAFHQEHGQRVPAWSLPSLRDRSSTLSLGQFRGHPLVLNFWASWCAPCRQEMAALAATARRLGGRVSFVGIDTNDQPNSALALLAQTAVAYPAGFDPHAGVAGANGVYGLPTTLFVSPQGTLLGRQVGAMTDGRLQQLTNQTFGVRPEPLTVVPGADPGDG